jgi:hypothetical protein
LAGRANAAAANSIDIIVLRIASAACTRAGTLHFTHTFRWRRTTIAGGFLVAVFNMAHVCSPFVTDT